jgi:hypothetical protein
MTNEKLNRGVYTGYWYLEGNQERQFAGTLKFNSDGKIIFKTLGSFEKKKTIDFYNNHIQYHLVYGVAIDENDKSYLFYLYNLAQRKYTTNCFDISTFEVSVVLIGEINRQELKDSFNTLFLSSSTWQNFIKTSGFVNIKNREEGFSSTHSYIQPETKFLHEDENYKVEVFFRATSQYKKKERSITEWPFLNVEFKRERGLKEIFKERIFFERLIMILFERRHTFSISQVRTGESTDLHIYEDRRVLDHLGGIKLKEQDFNNTFSDYFIKWKEVEEKYELPIKTFFFALTDYKMDVNSQFLNYVFALEQFHKILFGEQKEPMAEKNKPMYEKAIAELQSEDVIKWLEQTFSKKKNVGFRRRLEALIARIKFMGVSLKDINRIESTRHYLVHLDEQHKDLALKGEEVYRINDKLVSLMFKLLKNELEVGTVKQLK